MSRIPLSYKDAELRAVTPSDGTHVGVGIEIGGESIRFKLSRKDGLALADLLNAHFCSDDSNPELRCGSRITLCPLERTLQDLPSDQPIITKKGEAYLLPKGWKPCSHDSTQGTAQ